MKLRPATLADAEMLLAWRNDPEARRQSFTTHEITATEMGAWLPSRVHTIRIAMDGDVPVGQVRIAPDGMLSFSVDACQRGRGYGTEIIAAVMDVAVSNGVSLIAQVKLGNKASNRVFQRLGWQIKEVTPKYVEYRYP